MDQLQQQLAQLLARQQVMETEMAPLQGQNQVLASAGLEQLPRLVASLEQQGAGSSHRRTLVDTRGLGRPERFKAQEGEWTQWARKFENYVAACHPGADVALEWATDQRVALTEDSLAEQFGMDADVPLQGH